MTSPDAANGPLFRGYIGDQIYATSGAGDRTDVVELLLSDHPNLERIVEVADDGEVELWARDSDPNETVP